MKILHTVEFYPPSSGGSQLVVRQLSERIAKMGHDVTVATTYLPERRQKNINGVRIAEFRISGNSVVGIKGEIKKYQEFLVKSDFDVVMNYAAQQWATDLAFEVLDKINAKKILVPCGYSALTNPAFSDYFAKLPTILKKYDASVYLSSSYKDIDFARAHKIKNVHVIPNGADEREFSNLKDTGDFKKKAGIKHFFILSVGNHTGSKGHAEMLKVFKYFPFPSTFVIIGGEGVCSKDCAKHANEINESIKQFGKRVLLLNLDRQPTVDALKSADLFFFLSNVEASPLVLFEAAAAGLPFLSSAAGNCAEIAEWTGGGIIADSYPDPDRPGNVIVSEKDALKKLIYLRLHPRKLKMMGRKARKNWQEKYTWQGIAEQYLKLYEEVLR